MVDWGRSTPVTQLDRPDSHNPERLISVALASSAAPASPLLPPLPLLPPPLAPPRSAQNASASARQRLMSCQASRRLKEENVFTWLPCPMGALHQRFQLPNQLTSMIARGGRGAVGRRPCDRPPFAPVDDEDVEASEGSSSSVASPQSRPCKSSSRRSASASIDVVVVVVGPAAIA